MSYLEHNPHTSINFHFLVNLSTVARVVLRKYACMQVTSRNFFSRSNRIIIKRSCLMVWSTPVSDYTESNRSRMPLPISRCMACSVAFISRETHDLRVRYCYNTRPYLHFPRERCSCMTATHDADAFSRSTSLSEYQFVVVL